VKSSPSSSAIIAMLADASRSKTSFGSWRLHARRLYDCRPPMRTPARFGHSCQQRMHTPLVLRSGILTKWTFLCGKKKRPGQAASLAQAVRGPPGIVLRRRVRRLPC
jgi:hypothetical protein